MWCKWAVCMSVCVWEGKRDTEAETETKSERERGKNREKKRNRDRIEKVVEYSLYKWIRGEIFKF